MTSPSCPGSTKADGNNDKQLPMKKKDISACEILTADAPTERSDVDDPPSTVLVMSGRKCLVTRRGLFVVTASAEGSFIVH